MDAPGQTKAIRVAVRVRPLLPSDGATDHSLLQLDPGRPNQVLLARGSDRRTARRYTFDQVFGPEVSQDELYGRAGVADMVAAVVGGYHATIFAYGQTGSGKTYTMEGYRYVTHVSAAASTSSAAAGGAKVPAPGNAAGRGGATRSAASSGPPQADFASTPDAQLGLTPRAVRELFAAAARDRSRRFTVRCSFVQIYREQVYDMLNPATLATLPGGGGGGGGNHRRPVSGPGGGGPLRMRWSQQDGFYLENLFMPEVESPEEAVAAFQTGVANKVMSSHRLNAASSRSHCLFTLHVTSAPTDSPLELTAAKLTLVDLAGSERAALTGATEGALRDESVAINKSLFTLRQVITALTDAAAVAPQALQPAPHVHVPYRDSKLTCLLRSALGGSAAALMVACCSPADRFLEENASTLEYAARARRVTNQVAVNEDPRSRLIRELRTEVAFLRQQLQAAGAAPPPLQLPPALAAAAAFGGGGAEGGAAAEDEAAYASRLRSTDVEVLVRAVIDASRVAVASSAALSGLRTAYARTAAALESLRVEYDTLASEDTRVRDRLSMLEALISGGSDSRLTGRLSWSSLPPPADSGGGGSEAPAGVAGCGSSGALYTASTAALIELEELRRENALLHERLRLLEPEIGPAGVAVMTATTRGPVFAGGAAARPGTGGPPVRGGSGGGGASRPATSGSFGLGSTATAAATRGPPGPGRRQQQPMARAQSAGALQPTSSGRLSATAVAAAAASNPFVPSDVLAAVLRSPAGGGRPLSGLRPQTGGGSSSAAAAGGGGSSNKKTMTVDQLRNVLQQTNGGGSGAATAASPSYDGADRSDADGGGAASVASTSSSRIAAAAAAAGGNRPPTSKGTLLGGGSSSGGGSAGGSSSSTGRLSELGHAVASRALTTGVRLSTTGKLLPAAPARMAVEAAAAGGGAASSPLRPGTSGTSAFVPQPAVVSTAAAMPPEAALAHLLAERNALTRQRLANAQ